MKVCKNLHFPAQKRHKLVSAQMLLVLIFLYSSSLIAQTKQLLYPSIVSFSEIPTIKLPSAEVDSLIANAQLHESKMTWQFSVPVTTQIASDKQGVWKALPTGGWVWYCKVYSRTAYSLRPAIGSMQLAKGAELRIFNQTLTQIERVRDTTDVFAPIQGSVLIFELYEPNTATHQSTLIINRIAHDYKDFFNTQLPQRGTAGSCNVDVNCPAGDNWQLEKRSVCKILFKNNEVCTGTLINNTANDQTPYVLTADHCMKSDGPPATALFYFNYESDSCGSSVKTKFIDTVKGAVLVAGPINKTVDFTLLRLSRLPVASIFPYLAGWDRSNKTPGRVTTIHHPRGDATKISVSYEDSVKTGTFAELTYQTKLVHWNVKSWQKGTTEGGSSGAALFNDSSHLLIGSLSGGDANCSSPRNDFFAKLSYNWDFFPNPENQLKPWLDPLNTGIVECQGLDIYQTTLNPATNISPKDTLVIPIVDPSAERLKAMNSKTSLSSQGVWTGNNNLGISAIAERFAGLSSRYLCAIKFPIAQLSNPSVLDKVILKIWDGTSAPAQVLYAREIGHDNVYDGKYCYIKIPQVIRTNGTFFVGLSFDNLSPEDVFSMYASKERRNKQNSAYGFCKNEWGSFKDMGYATALAIEVYMSVLNECKDTILTQTPQRLKGSIQTAPISYITKEFFEVDSVQNFIEHNNYTISRFSDKWGYCTGNNGYGYTAFAEKIAMQDAKYVNAIKIAVARKKRLASTAKVLVCLWSASAKGYPEQILFAKEVLLDSLQRDSFNVVRLPRPIYIDSLCFAGIKLPDLSEIDTFALYQSIDTVSGMKSYYFADDNWQSYSLASVKNKLAVGISTGYSVWTIDERKMLSAYPLQGNIIRSPNFIKNDITIFPNPTSSQTIVNVYFGSFKHFETITAQLQTIAGQQYNITVFNIDQQANTAQMDISNIRAGVYALKVTIDGSTFVKQLVVLQ